MRRRGANAIEFALIFPAFLVISWWLVELTWLSYRQSAAAEAVDWGCRQAALLDPGRAEADASTLLAAARDAMRNLYDADGCDECVADATLVGTVPQRSIECTLDVDYQGITAMLGPTRISSEAIVRLEYQRRLE